MSLYELARKVEPTLLKDHESKVIWKGRSGEFAYLFKEDSFVFLRLSGSSFQLEFYHLTLSGWEVTSPEMYQGAVELWQDEKADKI